MKYIRDRGMKATKIFATLMALGVVASGIFGMTQAGKYLVDKTLYIVGLYTVFPTTVTCLTTCQTTCQATLACVQAVTTTSQCCWQTTQPLYAWCSWPPPSLHPRSSPPAPARGSAHHLSHAADMLIM